MNLNRIAKYCSVIVIALVAITALGPVGWQPRTSLGWEFDHSPRLFRDHLAGLLCLAAADHRRGRAPCFRSAARVAAELHTGSLAQSYGRNL